MSNKYVKFGLVIAIIVVSLGYLAYTGVRDSKSYYVTIKELKSMDDSVYAKRLRVAGNVVPGSIKRQGTHVEFQLAEEGRTLPVVYNGTEVPPDTFKDDSQALAEGPFGHDGVFHAKGCKPSAPRSTRRNSAGAAPSAQRRHSAIEPDKQLCSTAELLLLMY